MCIHQVRLYLNQIRQPPEMVIICLGLKVRENIHIREVSFLIS